MTGTQKTSEIGLVGLAVMGQNLALNIARKGFPISVFNRTFAKTEEFLAQIDDEPVQGFAELADFVGSLARPRRVLLLVKAGAATEQTIEKLLPLLERGDMIIDGGNAHPSPPASACSSNSLCSWGRLLEGTITI